MRDECRAVGYYLSSPSVFTSNLLFPFLEKDHVITKAMKKNCLLFLKIWTLVMVITGKTLNSILQIILEM